MFVGTANVEGTHMEISFWLVIGDIPNETRARRSQMRQSESLNNTNSFLSIQKQIFGSQGLIHIIKFH